MDTNSHRNVMTGALSVDVWIGLLHLAEQRGTWTLMSDRGRLIPV